LLSGYILIWFYPKKLSMKDIFSKPHVLSIMMSVMNNKDLSLGQVMLRSWKSLQTLIFPFFLVWHNISNLGWVLFLSNETTFDELVNFSFNWLYDVRAKSSLLLFNRFNIRFDVEMMHGHLRVKTRHVFIAPCKDIYIFSYKRYKVLLFCWQ